MKLLARFLFFIVFILAASVFAAPASAATARGGQAVYIPKGQVVTGTLFAGAKTSVTIDGTVHGDVFCGSQDVIISGTVDGDVICAAQTIRIDGSVGGSVRVAGQSIEVAGPVGRNITAIGQSFTLDPTGTVSGEILAATEHTFIDGTVKGDISEVVNSLVFGDNAKVKGSVKYQSKNAASLAPTATISGMLVQTTPKPKSKPPTTEVKRVSKGAGGVVGKIILSLIFGAIIVAIAPKKTAKILDLMKSSPGASMLTGFLAMLVIPMVLILMAITIIGIPFSILLGIVFALALAAASIFASLLAGRFVLDKLNANKKNNMYVNLLVGVPVVGILFTVPILGGLAKFLAAIWGLGAIVKLKKGNK